MHPFCARRELIASIPGIGVGASATVISEIGADPAAWFPSAEHLASWVRLCPGNHESAGKRHHGARRTGNQHLQPVLVECAWAAVRTDGYLREYYRTRISAPTTSPPAWIPTKNDVASSPNSKPKDWGSPSNLPPETPTYTLSPTDPASLQSPAGHACRGHLNSRTSPHFRAEMGAFATARLP
ncbi:IS110 family transposase [Mycobacterium tuberculosis]